MSTKLLIEPRPPGATKLRISEARHPEGAPLAIHFFKGQFDPGSRKTPMRFRISMEARLKRCLELIKHVLEDSVAQSLLVDEVMKKSPFGHPCLSGHGLHANSCQAMLESKASCALDKLEANKIRIFLAAVCLCHSENIPYGMFNCKKIALVLNGAGHHQRAELPSTSGRQPHFLNLKMRGTLHSAPSHQAGTSTDPARAWPDRPPSRLDPARGVA